MDMEKITNSNIKDQLQMNELFTIKAKQSEDIEKTIKSISSQLKNKDFILEQVKDLFHRNNFVYREKNMTIDLLLLSIVLFDISGQYDKYFREENIIKIKEICRKWDIPYDYMSAITNFHENVVNILGGKK